MSNDDNLLVFSVEGGKITIIDMFDIKEIKISLKFKNRIEITLNDDNFWQFAVLSFAGLPNLKERINNKNRAETLVGLINYVRATKKRDST